ncbi:rRNA maturation RNase YbeY [Alicyclobacillaceae bacterium I2511]|nr:rRNA maturation RNase YbeY [Alicyclobacillaceae bacterium I2511]
MSLSVEVDIRAEIPEELFQVEQLTERVLVAAAGHLHVSGEVSISFVSDAEIQELNRSYRHVDWPTDVLSFALREGEEDFVLPEGATEPLGDIIVSIPAAVRQSIEYGHSLRREVGFLLVHGFLHLLGYDHQDTEAEQEMTGIQEAVLSNLGLTRELEERP